MSGRRIILPGLPAPPDDIVEMVHDAFKCELVRPECVGVEIAVKPEILAGRREAGQGHHDVLIFARF
jgi:hypothetical protein